MKSKLILLFVLICASSWLQSTIYHINQDGTGNFTTIQEGINAAIDADTILVYPGTYFENVDFLSKSIILGSLYLTTGNEDYVSQTVINGNQSGSCVEVRDCIEEFTTISGFTIENGSGNAYSSSFLSKVGGGIYVFDSILSVIHCKLLNNIAEHGGGIIIVNSYATLSGTIIKHNRAYSSGGGITLAVNSEINFDGIDLCNIYLNYSARGSDIYKVSSPPLEVLVDTFTVYSPDEYFVYSLGYGNLPLYDITLGIQNAKLVPVDADLFVSPNGNNSNSGLTSNEPLATINYAYSLTQPDSLENNTIYIADGIYSTTLNDQWFPLQMRGYINLVGESMENTILDAENSSSFITDMCSDFKYTIKNLNLLNGYGVFNQGGAQPWLLCFEDTQFRDLWVRLENLMIHDNEATSRDLALWFISAYLKNVHFYDNVGTSNTIESLSTFNNEIPFITVELENCSIKNCHTSGMVFDFGSPQYEKSHAILKNVEVTDNLNPEFAVEQSCGLMIGNNWQVDMINCTLGNDAVSSSQGGPIDLIGSSIELNIYNSILYGNYPRNIWTGNDDEDYPNVVNIYNSLVEDGEESCYSLYPWDEINFVENNLVGETNPFWIDSGVYPYQLSTGSPCINTGTLDLPEGLELPEFDLAGNPRIYGNTIDMGAYEWQGVGIQDEEIPAISTAGISNYPNPFNPSTTISYNVTQTSSFVNLSIYNIKGQKVKQLINAQLSSGNYTVTWNGRDNSNKRVSSGEYFAKLKVNREEVAINKMLLLK